MNEILPVYVSIKNFLSYEEQIFYFRRGTYGIIGLNKDSINKDKSNGSGKTGIGEAVLFAITGRTFKNLKGDDIVREGQKNCLVKFTFKINNRIAFIESGRKPNILRFFNGKKFIKANSKSELQKKIMDFFGIDYDIITRFFIIGEKDKHKFSFLGSDDRTIKDILTKLTNSEIIDNAHKIANDKAQAYRDKLKTYQITIDTNNNLVKDLKEEIVDIKNKLSKESKETSTALIDKYESDLKKYKVSLKKNELKLRDFEQLMKDMESKNDSALQVKEKLLHKYEIDFGSIRAVLNVESITCPKCKTELKILGNSLYNTKQYVKNKKRAKELKNKIEELKNEISKIENYKNEKSYKSLKDNYDKYDDERDEIKDSISRVEDDLKTFKLKKNIEIKNLTLNYLSLKKRINKIKLENKEAIRKSVFTEELLNISKKFLFYFGKEGMKNFLFSKKLKLIEHFVNQVLVETNTDMSVKLNGMTKLKSGKWNQKISGEINVNGKNRNFDKLSKGEARIIDLAFIKAMSDLFSYKNKFMLKIFDEPFGGLDNDGKNEVINMLKNIKRECIYIISPESNLIRTNFEDEEIFSVIKQNAISTIHRGDYK